MARYVIDPPTLLRIVAGGRQVDAAHQVVAVNSVRSEALQLLLDEVRRGERTDRSALELHERITELKMRLLGDRGSRGMAWRIAREQDWDNLREAEYLGVTKLQADALVTVDYDFAERAKAVVDVQAIEVLFSDLSCRHPGER